MAKVKRKRKKLSAAEKALKRLRTQHTKMLRGSLRDMGFKEIEELRDHTFKLDNFTSDVDDVFVYENVLLFVERTTGEKTGGHFKSKLPLYQHISANRDTFTSMVREWDALKEEYYCTRYDASEVFIEVIYCSHHELSQRHKSKIGDVHYLDYGVLRYFYALANAIKKSARSGFFEFLGLDHSEIGHDGVIGTTSSVHTFDCIAMNHTKANLPEGFQIVTMYLDAETILDSAYVLRRQGWNESMNAYQRMLIPKKIKDIREYIAEDGKAFMNNIIVTLPPSTAVEPIESKKGIGTSKVTIPTGINTIGIVDGQHRVLSFYKGEPFEAEIAERRKRQNLLTTAIIYPEGISEHEREAFEAGLFLEINATQSAPPPALRLAIETLTAPFSENAIANNVMGLLDKSGPLSSKIEKYFFETDKLKPSSIVKFQINHLVRIPSVDAEEDRPRNLFDHWNGHGKQGLKEGKDYAALERYTEFCAKKINELLIGFKRNTKASLWTASRKVEGRILTTLRINFLMACLRNIAREYKELPDQDSYAASLNGFSFEEYETYKSSQYNAMGEEIFQDYFED